MAISVRPAEAGDVGLIWTLIRELADYERLLDQVTITPDRVRSLLFDLAPAAFCDIAMLDGEAVGFALWFYNVSTFEGHRGLYLEDLYVRPAARGAGAGMALMARLARRCREEGLSRMEWAVLDWNAAAIAFYDHLGAASAAEWITRRLSGAALDRLARRA